MVLFLERLVDIELFDTPDMTAGVLEQVQAMVKVDHIVTWSAQSGI
jgi:hypothetical protein